MAIYAGPNVGLFVAGLVLANAVHHVTGNCLHVNGNMVKLHDGKWACLHTHDSVVEDGFLR